MAMVSGLICNLVRLERLTAALLQLTAAWRVFTMRCQTIPLRRNREAAESLIEVVWPCDPKERSRAGSSSISRQAGACGDGMRRI
jgi:hypothetical protein